MFNFGIARFWTTERGAFVQLIVRFTDGRWASFARIWPEDDWSETVGRD